MARPSIKTIAREANVSIATVSKALNDMPDVSTAAKERIRAIAAAQGYTVNQSARQLASGQSFSAGILLPNITHPGPARIFKIILSRLNTAGYSVFVGDTAASRQGECAQALKMLEDRVGALIVMPVGLNVDHINEIIKEHIPVITINGAPGKGLTYAVLGGDYQGGRMAARHLYHCGHRCVRVFSLPGPDTVAHQRMRGFVEYMQNHHCNVDVREAPAGTEREAAGVLLARRMVEKDRPHTAIFSVDDTMAIGAMHTFAQCGWQVPNNISIVGYGDSPAAGLRMVNLSTVCPPYEELGIYAGDMAIDLMRDGRTTTSSIQLEPRLIKRGSVCQLEKT